MDIYRSLPDLLDEAYCCKCGEINRIIWLGDDKGGMPKQGWHAGPGLPYCQECHAVNWSAMAHLNRRRSCYCQNRRD